MPVKKKPAYTGCVQLGGRATKGGGRIHAGVAQLQTSRRCLQHLFRLGPCGYRLRRDIPGTTEHTLLVLTLPIGLDGRLDNASRIGGTTLRDHTKGNTLDTLALVRTGSKFIQQRGGYRRHRQDQDREHPKAAARQTNSVR